MKKLLYLGIDPPDPQSGYEMIHYPLIETIPRNPHCSEIREAFQQMPHYSHLIFTSKNGVRFFVEHHITLGGHLRDVIDKKILCVGKKTAEVVHSFDLKVSSIATEETAEGVVALMQDLSLQHDTYFFWPHSALSRTVIPDFFDREGYRYCACSIYDTKPIRPKEEPPLHEIDEILFTSPSTVEAYVAFFGSPPPHVKLKAIGPVTQNLINKQNFHHNNKKMN